MSDDERLSLDTWRQAVDGLHEAVIAANESNRIVYANLAAEELLGWPPGTLAGQPLTTIIPERLQGRHRTSFRGFVHTGESTIMGRPLRVPACRRDGTEMHVELLVSAAPLPTGTLLVGLLRDISVRVDLEGPGDLTERLFAAVADTSNLQDSLDRVLAALGEVLGWEVVQLWLADLPSGRLVRQASWTCDPATQAPFVGAAAIELGFDVGLPGRAYTTGEPVWINDLATDAVFVRTDAAAATGLQSGFAFPIATGGRTIGVIELFASDRRAFSHDLVEHLRVVGVELGSFIERRTSEEERMALLEAGQAAAVGLEQAHRRLEGLYRDLAEAHAALGFQSALLQTQNEAGFEGQLVVSPDGEMISFNRRFAEMWGFAQDVIDHRSDAEALAAAMGRVVDPDAFMARVQHLYETKSHGRDEVELCDGRVFDRVGSPLVTDGTYLGYAWYFRDISDQKRSEQQLARAGRRSDALARTLQQSLLPPTLPTVPGARIAARYHPAGAGFDVGGDFYDVFRTGRGTWGIVMGDVCGSGADAATITALARYTIRAAAMQSRSPARTLRTLNEAMLRQSDDGGPNRFVTVALARLRPARGSAALTLACGGHPLPLVRRASGKVHPVGRHGTLLGVLANVQLHDHEVMLGPGDTIVFVTDGVLEARAGEDQFGEEGLAKVMESSGALPVDELAEAIEQAALDHQHGGNADHQHRGTSDHQHGGTSDDLAVLVLGVPT